MTTSSPPELERLYSVSELASSWGVDRKLVVKLLNEGELHGHKVGMLYRVRASSVDAYLERHRVADFIGAEELER